MSDLPQPTSGAPHVHGSNPTPPTGPYLITRLQPLTVSEVYPTYWRFAAERQAIFFRRLVTMPGPWTRDPVLASHKFTNAYRASDRTSQYLIRHVIYRQDLPTTVTEVIFRVLLFKFFNRIETWQLLERALEPITYADYTFRRYNTVLSRARSNGHRLYSAAYIMPPRRASGNPLKHETNLQLLETMMRDNLPERLADSQSMREGFELLRSYPTIGDFLAYQFVTDINYSECTTFDEMEFVIPGPGARDGIEKCFVDRGDFNESDLIRLVADVQEQEFERLGLDFQTLWGRRLQLIDCQNLFCEVGKYARLRHPEVRGLTGRTRIKQKFRPKTTAIQLFYPPKWGLNGMVVERTLGLPLEAPAGAAPADGSTRRTPPLELNMYQEEALRTDRTHTHGNAVIVPMLGLAGEAGQLLSEYKKLLRDGDTHVRFKDRVREELGDLLWYMASVAAKFQLELADVARGNLEKVRARWGKRTANRTFDTMLPDAEQLPRKFCVRLADSDRDGTAYVRVSINGVQFGDELTDNSYQADGYRFHDVFHLAYAAVLGWSPVTRSLLRRKRKSQPELDEVEDGGRASVIEEGVAALAFDYARRHRMLQGVRTLDYDLLRTIKGMTSHLEVNCCTTGEWEDAILQGFSVWRHVVVGGGGYVSVDLDERQVRYLGPIGPADTEELK